GKDLMQSFQRTADLAQQSASAINVTWAGGGVENPDVSMGRFAEVLAGLAHRPQRPIGKLKWVTVQNEPNRTRITMKEYERQYRRLDAHLRTLGVRNQI